MKEIKKTMTQMMKKIEKTCLKGIIFKFFDVIPMIVNLFKFLGEINLYISKLREKSAANKAINKITEDSYKIVAVTKLKELKRYAENILPNYKK